MIDLISWNKFQKSISKAKGRQFDKKTKKWTIAEEDLNDFKKVLEEFANVQFVDKISIKVNVFIEKENNSFQVKITNFEECHKQEQELLTFFKTITNRSYDFNTREWKFAMESYATFQDGKEKLRSSGHQIDLFKND